MVIFDNNLIYSLTFKVFLIILRVFLSLFHYSNQSISINSKDPLFIN